MKQDTAKHQSQVTGMTEEENHKYSNDTHVLTLGHTGSATALRGAPPTWAALGDLLGAMVL